MAFTLTNLSTNRIWPETLQADFSLHCGFTDLIQYNQLFIVGFREGSSHMSLDGEIHLMVSEDFENWRTLKRLKWQGGDLRDPKFIINELGELIISCGVRVSVSSSHADGVFSTAWTMNQALVFSDPVVCETSSGTWRWGMQCNRYGYFSVGYARRDRDGCLYQSSDGLNWQRLVKPFFPESNCFTNESSLAFNGEKLYCLTRQDGGDECLSLLGSADKPYQNWQWQKIDTYIGGPKLLFVKQKLLAIVRLFEEATVSTQLFEVVNYQKKPSFKHLLTLPSAGDTSYAGAFFSPSENRLKVSYYASHEAVSAIYVADIQVNF